MSLWEISELRGAVESLGNKVESLQKQLADFRKGTFEQLREIRDLVSTIERGR
jgi:uncharacterized protein Yka (UPF0111/DUF47 family)